MRALAMRALAAVFFLRHALAYSTGYIYGATRPSGGLWLNALANWPPPPHTPPPPPPPRRLRHRPCARLPGQHRRRCADAARRDGIRSDSLGAWRHLHALPLGPQLQGLYGWRPARQLGPVLRNDRGGPRGRADADERRDAAGERLRRRRHGRADLRHGQDERGLQLGGAGRGHRRRHGARHRRLGPRQLRRRVAQHPRGGAHGHANAQRQCHADGKPHL